MAPELIGETDDPIPPTFASDVYSFASVTYEVRFASVPLFSPNEGGVHQILTGRIPFFLKFGAA
jgi:serine/threonine protein kinase